ncbi:MAG: hypothetical protein AAFR97_08155 [Bacteroidota bacterium]
MSFPVFSTSDLIALRQNERLRMLVDFLYASDHDSRITAIERIMDSAYKRTTMNANFHYEKSEDEITISIVDMIRFSGIDIAHDRKIGGHCDITILSSDDFLWIAEAKIHSSYNWLDKGFKQLATRYSTGSPGQDHGEVLIYCKVKDAKSVLETWRDELTTRHSDVVIVEDNIESQLRFRTTHVHERSGLTFYIRHRIVSVFFDPIA